MASPEYVEFADGVFRITGTRVHLDALVALFLDGRSPDEIAQSFPAITLEQVYGALAYYLAHRPDIDEHIARNEAAYEAARAQSHEVHRDLLQRLRLARRQGPATAS